jgi:glycosyltransferase involved in cell wall biosynthesis
MLKISAIIPAYNEAENIALVVGGLRALRDAAGLPVVHEVIVADNNSNDETATIARQHGARVVHVAQKGYGNACAVACQHAMGDVLLFVDGDHTADLAQASLLMEAIAQGADLAIGVRTNAARGSLTLPQRFGNFLACFLVRLIWSAPVTDLGPFRAVRRAAYERIGMRDRSFGWTVEMQIRAIQLKLVTTEIGVSWFTRHAGTSKVSGTVKGVIGAGVGILSMIARLWWRERRAASHLQKIASSPTTGTLPTGQVPLPITTPRRSFLNQE